MNQVTGILETEQVVESCDGDELIELRLDELVLVAGGYGDSGHLC
jgi:hypothetical protein